MEHTTTGSNNIAIGFAAGLHYTGAESNNITIGANVFGVAGESNVIRIGDLGATGITNFQAGIFGVTPGFTALPVFVDANGQLGTGAILSCNIAFGQLALANNTTGIDNTAIGCMALEDNTTGNNNVAVGFNALNTNTTVSQLTAVGSGALQNNTGGTQNSALGYQALNVNTVGGGNTAVGFNALLDNTASQNTAVGVSHCKQIQQVDSIQQWVLWH